MKKRYVVVFVFLLLAICVVLYSFLWRKGENDSFDLDFEVIPQSVCGISDRIYLIGNLVDEDKNSIYCFHVTERKLEKVFQEEDELCHWHRIFSDGYCLYAIRQRKNEGYEIVIFEENGKTISAMNLKGALEENSQDKIRSFLIDEEGYFFVRTYAADGIYVFDERGQLYSYIEDLMEEAIFESMTVCDGKVYALFSLATNEGGYSIVNYQAGKAEEICYGNLLPSNDFYSVMGTGEEYDLYIKGDLAVYGYRLGDDRAELLAGLSLEKYDFTKSCFSTDNRLYCFAMRMSRNGSGSVEKISLKTMYFDKVSEK